VLGTIAGISPLALPLRPERRSELALAGYEVCDSPSAAAALGASKPCCHRYAAASGDAQAALHAGLDVLLEKPMAPDALRAQEICLTARQSGRRLFVGCNLRFDNALNTFRALLPRLGRLHSVRVECQSYLPDWRPERPYKQSYSARADEAAYFVI